MQNTHLFTLPRILLSLSIVLLTSVNALVIPRAIANGIDLRILPVGDSITWGAHSTDGNGYREHLLEKLQGNNVEYVGTVRSGTMKENHHEGWRGYVISQIAAKAKLSLPYRPNVVLMLAGTNDIGHNVDPAGAPQRLGQFLDECHDLAPDAVVIVAKLIPREQKEDEVVTFNNAVPGIVEPRVKAGHKIVIVDMGNSKDGLTTKDLADGLHPNDGGYAKMANVWLDGFNEASSKGLITPPFKVTNGKCDGQIQWEAHGKVADGAGSKDSAVFFGDLTGDGKDDYLAINKTGGVLAYKNEGANDKANNGWIWSPLGNIFGGGTDLDNIR